MSKIKYFTIAFCLTIFSNLYSQKGKDGARTISAANTKINEFTALAGNAISGNTTLSVTASALNTNTRFASTLSAGDLVMVIQMQGALTKTFGYSTPWLPDSTYGYVWNYATCGNYEFAEVKSVISATQIELTCGLTYAYSSAGKTQVVRVPRYTSLLVASTGTLTSDAWNGTIGGVLVAEVNLNTIIDGVVSANALGFRGGTAVGNGGSGNGNFVTRNPNDGAQKGEGIGSDRLSNAAPDDTLGIQCKGAPGNAGGGGNANNCGGGGGGNGGMIGNYNGYGVPATGYTAFWNLEWPGRASVTSSGGGKGGYGTATTTTPNINSVGPNNNAWGTFKRPSFGGFGGRPLDYSTGKLFMGGGGGAGHMTAGQSTGPNACSGGAGGGLIFLLNYGSISGTGTVSANGADGNNAFGNAIAVRGIDGAGGAGAGGTIILKSNGPISSITANANGGKGGDQVKTGAGVGFAESQGPGGGGGGGYIAGNGSVFVQNVNGGSNGTTNSTNFAAFPMNGGTAGDVGTKNQTISPSFSLTASANQTLCANQSATLNATSTNSTATVLWYNTAAGGNSIASGTVYTTPTFTTTGTYTVYAGSCPGIYRVPIIITVGAGATITVNSATICPGQTITLTANGASTYTWNTGPTTNTISVSPTSTSVYTVNATSGTCNGVQTSTVTVSGTPTISVANATICSGNSTTLTASGATNYTWMPGGQITSSVVVTPSTNTTYTITGANGTCSNTTTASVSITSAPLLSISSRTICAGQVATFTVSGATTYTWNPGNTSGSTYTTSPSSSGTISVIGANGSCTAQISTSITVTPNPTVAVTNQTICAGQTAILTASAATTYSWNTGPTTNTISVSPASTTIYTVVGTSSSCSNTKTVSVTVSSQPTVAVSNATICSGTSTILIASGASNYTWNPGGQTTSSITVTPNTNTIYTVTGANGTCSNTATSSVSVTSTPTLVVNSATICPAQTATLTVSGATTYTWNPGNLTGNTYTINPAASTTVNVLGANGTCTAQATASISIGSNISIAVNNPTICAGQTASLTASGATSYTWSTSQNTNTLNVTPASTTIYTIAGMNGSCSGSNTAVVTVVAVPSVSVTSSTICSGSSATLIATGASNYTWSPGGQTTTSITQNPNTTTIYTVTGSNGTCTNSAMGSINVTTTPTINVNTTSICAGQTATLIATGATNYTWSTTQNTASITVSPALTSTYSVLGDNGACTSAQTTTVTVTASPTLNINANTTTGCAPLCINFTDATSSSCSTISYNFGDGNTASSNNPNHCYTANGNFTVTATCTNTLGCATTYTMPTAVQVILTPVADFTIQEGNIVSVGNIVHLINTSSNATSSNWDFCNGVSILTDATTSYQDTGSCCITLLIANATCTNTVTKCLTVVREAVVVIPNVFTPNGDGSNEFFKITSSGLKSLTCVIFDRWGLKMYEWDGINGYWDGATKLGPATDGTYFYIVTYTDQQDNTTTEKGFLNLFHGK